MSPDGLCPPVLLLCLSQTHHNTGPLAGDAFIVIANNITNISDGLVVIVIVLIDDPTTP